MSKHYENHAEEVTQAFVGMLDEGVSSQISDEHRKELAMMIEAAISTAVLSEIEQAAEQLADMSQKLREHAERYDKG